MIKICSLDFLHRTTFDADVFSENGEVLIHVGDKVTPELLLKLYFQNIYVEKDLCEIEKEKQEAALARLSEQKEKETAQAKAQEDSFEASKVSDKQESEIEEPKEEAPKMVVFDEQRAARMVQHSQLMGKAINLSAAKLKELEQAAYNYNIGASRLLEEDLLNKDFKKKLASISYDIMLNELNFPENIAEVAHLYLEKYESKGFKLEKQNGAEIPYYHIIAIADYYENLLVNQPKEKVLLKMLELGGNKFNIFVLHKFINAMRSEDA